MLVIFRTLSTFYFDQDDLLSCIFINGDKEREIAAKQLSILHRYSKGFTHEIQYIVIMNGAFLTTSFLFIARSFLCRHSFFLYFLVANFRPN
jgi:hypothetical protein